MTSVALSTICDQPSLVEPDCWNALAAVEWEFICKKEDSELGQLP